MDTLNRPATTPPPARDGARAAFLAALGETVRTARARRGLTRKALARDAGVSERHLANLESGVGNPSILVLRQVALALACELTEIVGDAATQSPERTLIDDLLRRRSEAELTRARRALAALFGSATAAGRRAGRLALIGLRGAGKSTLGPMLADALGCPFVELSREIARVAGCSIPEIHALYGLSAYRRYERRALEETLATHARAVIATPGGLVVEAATFNLLLEHCFTVWLQATPEEHMNRVIAQGDLRPMSGNAEAMEDLQRILAGRSAFYAKADVVHDTAGETLAESFEGLAASVRAGIAAVD
jgi:XRE family transcriptional regulator, aerobic/anaerobic benzoate catabolism transcriptional regulator